MAATYFSSSERRMDNGLGRLETFLEDSTSFLSGGGAAGGEEGGETEREKGNIFREERKKKRKISFFKPYWSSNRRHLSTPGFLRSWSRTLTDLFRV